MSAVSDNAPGEIEEKKKNCQLKLLAARARRKDPMELLLSLALDSSVHVQDRGGKEGDASSFPEADVGYHPCAAGFLTCTVSRCGGQCQAGELTWGVASERVSESLQRVSPQMDETSEAQRQKEA